MIKIYDKLWYILGVDRKDLAYMCQYETSKSGEVLANITKLQETGRDWARKQLYDYTAKKYLEPVEGVETIVDNTPLSGFYIGDSVSRWSTSNKLFRVKDPRGFVVEVPTGNIATLLHHTTVTNGIVMDKCVWGKDGNNHILLPINSEPYLETLGKMDTLANKLISKKDLKAEDWVKFFEDDREYCYLGKLKLTWKVRPFNYGRKESSVWCNSLYYSTKIHGPEVIHKETKWRDVFAYKDSYYFEKYGSISTTEPSQPKIVEVFQKEPIKLEDGILNINAREFDRDTSNYYGYDFELIGIERK